MSPADIAFLGAAVIFALVCGANDGATLSAMSLSVPAVRLWFVLLASGMAIVVVPLVVGIGVAETFTTGLVDSEVPSGRVAFGAALVATLVVVAFLTRSGLPTSLTLGFVGAIAGGGLGLELDVSLSRVGFTLLASALAPVVGAGAALLLSKAMSRSSMKLPSDAWLGGFYVGVFAFSAAAYAANDGQKMIGMAMVSLGPSSRVPLPAICGALGILFVVGAVMSLHRVVGSVSGRILLVRPHHAVTSQLGASIAVVGGALLKTPISMTQSLSAAVVGTGFQGGHGPVRWEQVARLAGAWACTLPATFGLAWLLANLAQAVM